MLPTLLLSCFLACRRYHSWSHFVLPHNATWKYCNYCLSQSGLSAACCLPKAHCQGRSQTNFPWLMCSRSIFIHHRVVTLTRCISKSEVSASLAVQVAGAHSPAAFLPTHLGGCQLRSTAQDHQPAGVVNILVKALILRCYTHSWLIPGLEDAEWGKKSQLAVSLSRSFIKIASTHFYSCLTLKMPF